MAVIAVNEIWQGRRGDVDHYYHRHYSRVFRVKTNSTLTSSVSVRSALGLPRLFDPYVEPDGTVDTGVLAVRIQERQTEDPLVWEVTVDYSSHVDFTLNEINPLLRPTEIKYGVEKYNLPITEDADGNAIVNSAGEPFDPAPEIDASRLTITMVRNELSYNLALYPLYFDVCNEDIFLGFAPRQVKCNAITGERLFENNTLYWRVTYEFAVRETWQLRLLDHGYFELVDGKKVLIRDKLGQPLTSPTLLDGTGKKLTPGDPPVFRTFNGYPVLPFADLNLP